MTCNCGNEDCNTCAKVALTQEPFFTHRCHEVCEDHSTHLVVHQYVGCVKISNAWAVPTGSSQATLKVPALVDILVGSYLWNPDYGSFIVVSFDKQGLSVKVQKDVNNSIASGTGIPACTKFLITTSELSDITVLQNDVNLIETNIDNIEANVITTGNDLNTLESTVSDISDDVDSLEIDVGSALSRVQRVASFAMDLTGSVGSTDMEEGGYSGAPSSSINSQLRAPNGLELVLTHGIIRYFMTGSGNFTATLFKTEAPATPWSEVIALSGGGSGSEISETFSPEILVSEGVLIKMIGQESNASQSGSILVDLFGYFRAI